MDNHDRQAIEDIFARLAQVERQSPPRDAEAEAFIRSELARQPAAPYYMAQTIVMQTYALEQAEARIADLEAALAGRPAAGGGGREPALAARTVPNAGGRPMGAPNLGAAAMGAGPGGAGAQAGPWAGGTAGTAAGRQGGGFLAGAAQTAMGVAGGLLLGNAIAGLFQGDAAHAAEAGPAAEAPVEEAPLEAAPDGGDGGGGFFDNLFGGDLDF